MERLQKYMARLGVASRRSCEDLIRAGRVRVDGRVATLGDKVDAEVNAVEVDGVNLSGFKAERFVYVMLYKPVGYVTTAHDELGRPTVLDLVGDYAERLYPVGRLDLDTEGLLLLTNDGRFTYHLTHPRYGINKEYVAKVNTPPSAAALERLRRGLSLEDGPTAPAEAELLPNGLVRLVIHEGRKRQVRRMLAAVGCPVLALRRTKLGNLSLRGLHRGEHRQLSAEEVAGLRLLYE